MSHSNKNIILTWNKNPEKDVVKYIVYLGDAESGFTASTGSLKNLLPYHELSSIDENTDIYDSIDYNNPVCELVSDAANNKYYCDFKYHAAKEKNAIDINLLPNKLYYMSGNSEFLYIIDSADQKNKIDKTSESEKFIAVTAVDLDGNEIDNTADDQKITLGGNMVNIMPKDLLEAGFARISGAGTFDFTTNNLQLSWNDVKYYLDGTDMERGVTVKYKVLAGSIKCKDTDILDKAMFSNILGPYDTSSNVNIDVTSVTGGRYCMGILPISDNNIESDGVLGTEMEIPEHAPSITP
jgi:hypothetical protein